MRGGTKKSVSKCIIGDLSLSAYGKKFGKIGKEEDEKLLLRRGRGKRNMYKKL